MIWCTPSHECQIKPTNENWWLHHLISQQPWVPFTLFAKTKQSHTKKKKKNKPNIQTFPITLDLLLTTSSQSQNIGSDKPCVLNLLAPRYKSHSKLYKKGLKEDTWGAKWVPQGIQSQRQVWFPGWNVSWLKWFISTSLEHTRHMLPFALRQLPCSRAGNRQGSESMARHWTPSLWKAAPSCNSPGPNYHGQTKMVKKVTKKTTGILKRNNKKKTPLNFQLIL